MRKAFFFLLFLPVHVVNNFMARCPFENFVGIFTRVESRMTPGEIVNSKGKSERGFWLICLYASWSLWKCWPQFFTPRLWELPNVCTTACTTAVSLFSIAANFWWGGKVLRLTYEPSHELWYIVSSSCWTSCQTRHVPPHFIRPNSKNFISASWHSTDEFMRHSTSYLPGRVRKSDRPTFSGAEVFILKRFCTFQSIEHSWLIYDSRPDADRFLSTQLILRVHLCSIFFLLQVTEHLLSLPTEQLKKVTCWAFFLCIDLFSQ